MNILGAEFALRKIDMATMTPSGVMDLHQRVLESRRVKQAGVCIAALIRMSPKELAAMDVSRRPWIYS